MTPRTTVKPVQTLGQTRLPGVPEPLSLERDRAAGLRDVRVLGGDEGSRSKGPRRGRNTPQHPGPATGVSPTPAEPRPRRRQNSLPASPHIQPVSRRIGHASPETMAAYVSEGELTSLGEGAAEAWLDGTRTNAGAVGASCSR